MQEIRDYWGWRVKLICHCPQIYALVAQLLPKPALTLKPAGNRADVVFEIKKSASGYIISKDGKELGPNGNSEIMLERLENAFQLEVASNAAEAVFVHAGAVAIGRKAAIFPGTSFAGKSSLVHELVRQGATYLSDEYAVIDKNGALHPYLRPISLRKNGQAALRIHPSQLGVAACKHYRLGLVLCCRYKKNARWRPLALSQGQAILELFNNTVSAQLRPERDLKFLIAATQEAKHFKTQRGDAKRVAGYILKLLSEE